MINAKRLNFSLILQVGAAIILTIYPFIIYFGIETYGINIIAPLFLILFALRFILAKGKIREFIWLFKATALLGCFLVFASWIFQQHKWLLFYPVVVNTGLLLLFGYSLFSPPSIIERLARIKEPDLPQEGIRYTRKVTQVWCLFFIFNGATALLISLYGNFKLWTIYNGLISYLLIGILFTVEWLVRKKFRTT